MLPGRAVPRRTRIGPRQRSVCRALRRFRPRLRLGSRSLRPCLPCPKGRLRNHLFYRRHHSPGRYRRQGSPWLRGGLSFLYRHSRAPHCSRRRRHRSVLRDPRSCPPPRMLCLRARCRTRSAPVSRPRLDTGIPPLRQRGRTPNPSLHARPGPNRPSEVTRSPEESFTSLVDQPFSLKTSHSSLVGGAFNVENREHQLCRWLSISLSVARKPLRPSSQSPDDTDKPCRSFFHRHQEASKACR